MSGITNPAEEYFKDGLWAWDPAGAEWLKLIIDPLTNQLSVAVNNDAEVHQTVPADFTPGVCGWDGAAWHKLPMVWGYSDRWTEALGGTKSGAGTYSKYTTAVPAGSVYVLEFVELQNNSGARGTVGMEVKNGVAAYAVAYFITPPQYRACIWLGRLTLKAGDQVRVTQPNCLDGDVLYGVAWGYEMKVAE